MWQFKYFDKKLLPIHLGNFSWLIDLLSAHPIPQIFPLQKMWTLQLLFILKMILMYLTRAVCVWKVYETLSSVNKHEPDFFLCDVYSDY